MLKNIVRLVLLLGAVGALPAAPMLFVGMDVTGTGNTNANAARAHFLSYLSGAGSDSFELFPHLL